MGKQKKSTKKFMQKHLPNVIEKRHRMKKYNKKDKYGKKKKNDNSLKKQHLASALAQLNRPKPTFCTIPFTNEAEEGVWESYEPFSILIPPFVPQQLLEIGDISALKEAYMGRLPEIDLEIDGDDGSIEGLPKPITVDLLCWWVALASEGSDDALMFLTLAIRSLIETLSQSMEYIDDEECEEEFNSTILTQSPIALDSETFRLTFLIATNFSHICENFFQIENRNIFELGVPSVESKKFGAKWVDSSSIFQFVLMNFVSLIHRSISTVAFDVLVPLISSITPYCALDAIKPNVLELLDTIVDALLMTEDEHEIVGLTQLSDFILSTPKLSFDVHFAFVHYVLFAMKEGDVEFDASALDKINPIVVEQYLGAYAQHLITNFDEDSFEFLVSVLKEYNFASVKQGVIAFCDAKLKQSPSSTTMYVLLNAMVQLLSIETYIPLKFGLIRYVQRNVDTLKQRGKQFDMVMSACNKLLDYMSLDGGETIVVFILDLIKQLPFEMHKSNIVKKLKRKVESKIN
ncbi:hypothetical protein PCE1_003913 [Barthelona sp. PCE]